MTLTDRAGTTLVFLILTSAGTGGQDLGKEGTPKSQKAQNEKRTSSLATEPVEACCRPTNFTFEKKGILISRPSGMPTPGPNYTCLVKMEKVRSFPHDYALYFSSDHARGEGGIWLYVCSGSPTEASNWKSYDQAVVDGEFDYLEDKPTVNPIFVDTAQGSQTETPYANVVDGTVYMTYHNKGAGHNQSTLLATSTDGVHFSRINGDEDSVILDYDPTTAPGNGHTGYFRWGPNPFSGIDYRFVGYSLHGGGHNYNSAIWASNDAITWSKLEVLTPIEGHAIEKGRLIIWHKIDPNSITSLGNGEYTGICTGGSRSSGGGARVHELYEIYLANDGRTLTRKSRKILANGPSGAADAEVLSHPTTILIKDTWHLIYVGVRGKARVNTVMGASGRLNKIAPKSERLKPSDQQRHFHNNKGLP